MANLETILSWFQTGDNPTEEEFRQTFSSFRHKDIKIPITEVEGLESSIKPQSDWNQSDSSVADFIKNKPNLSLKADLVAGKVPASQLPSYVDDFIPLTGTLSSKPIVGDLVLQSGFFIKKKPAIEEELEGGFGFVDNSGTKISSHYTGGAGTTITVLPSNMIVEIVDTQFAFEQTTGISSTKDFSGVENHLAFAQQKYVNDKVNLQHLTENNPVAFNNENFISFDINNNGENIGWRLREGQEINLFRFSGVGFYFIQSNNDVADECMLSFSRYGALAYGEDYSTKYTDRSLVDKAFVINSVGIENKVFFDNFTGTTITLTNTPKINTIVSVIQNGLTLRQGATRDYIISENTVVFNSRREKVDIEINYTS